MFHLLLAVLLLAESSKDVDSSPIKEARKDLQDNWFTRALKYMESNPETLEELMSKQYVTSEGDMMLSNDSIETRRACSLQAVALYLNEDPEELVKEYRMDRNAVESMWPTLEIPYVISPDLASRTHDILSAMAMVSEHTCMSFHKRTSETNYLLFKTSKGCASYVGFIGGEQPVFVGPMCIVGNIVHEILHALGFHHEHTRKDREQYITILPHNIMKGMERNFKKQQGRTFDLRYDVKSIMHYGSEFFSANGLPTIVPLVDVENMGQRVKMTKTDIERVRHLYNCDGTKKEPQKQSGGVEEEEDKEEKEEKEEDVDVHVLLHDVTTSKPQEDHTSTTRGQNHSS